MDTEAYNKYERAKKRVKELKGFYDHVRIFIVVNILVYVARFYILPKIGVIPQDEGFINWLDWNTYLLPVFWGVGLCIHGIGVYRNKFKFLRGWEDRKIKEFMDKEDESSNNRWS